MDVSAEVAGPVAVLALCLTYLLVAWIRHRLDEDELDLNQGPMSNAIFEGLRLRDMTHYELSKWIVQNHPGIITSAFAPTIWRLKDAGLITYVSGDKADRLYIHLVNK